MRLLRKAAVTKCVGQQSLENLIKDLLESPEKMGKVHFATKLIFSASGVDGKALRDEIHLWLSGRPEEEDNVVPPIKEPIKIDLAKAFDELLPEDSDGKTA